MICLLHKLFSHPTTYHHSTETVVHMTTSYLISKYNGHFSVIILLDLFVAFKTVDLMADHWALLVVLFCLTNHSFSVPFIQRLFSPHLAPQGFHSWPPQSSLHSTLIYSNIYLQIYSFKYLVTMVSNRDKKIYLLKELTAKWARQVNKVGVGEGKGQRAAVISNMIASTSQQNNLHL